MPELVYTVAMLQPYPSLQLCSAGNISRRALPLLTACLILAATRVVFAQDSYAIPGVWRGNSVCAVPDSPCQDEVNVYRFSEIPGKPNRFSCTGSKIVDSKEIVMGGGEWTYDPAQHLLQTAKPKIQLTLDHDSLDGALSLPNGTTYRRIHLKKSRE